MENAVLKQLYESDSKQELKIQFPQVISHAVSYAMTEIVPALESVLLLHNIPRPVFDITYRAKLIARELTAKTSALAELFGDPDSVSEPKMASYEIDQFFRVFTEHFNQSLSRKIRGNVQFEIESGSENGVVFDARRVSMILYHLISNSLQHGRTENKKVKLICKATRNSFELIVRDYGGGIPDSIHPVLFTVSQGRYNLNQEMLGILPPRIQGLGLPLCQKLAKDMGGELSFRNYRAGAQFTLTLPQEFNRMQELSVYTPDDTLLQNCMATLLLYLENQEMD